MTSMTSETSDTLNLTRDGLTLVVVSPDYFRTGDAHGAMPNGDDESRTYYATTSRTFGPDSEWGVILVDWEADPRGRIGWRVGDEFSDALGDANGHAHGGWNVRRQYLTPVVDSRRPAEEASPEATTAPETAPETFTREDVDRMVEEARRAVRAEAEQRFEDWKERASEIACQYAEENSLCGEFERCMEEIGLQGRSRDYVVSLTVTVSSRNEDTAREDAIERLYEMGRTELGYAIDDVEEA